MALTFLSDGQMLYRAKVSNNVDKKVYVEALFVALPF